MACTEKLNEETKIRSRSRYTVRVDLNPSICPTANVSTSTLQLPRENTDGNLLIFQTGTNWRNEATFPTNDTSTDFARYVCSFSPFFPFFFLFFFLIETQRLLRSIEKQLKSTRAREMNHKCSMYDPMN